MHLNPADGPEPDDVVRATNAWYDREAAGYTARSVDYGQYPGLLAEIERFVVRIGDTDGPVLDLGSGAGRDTEFLLRSGLRVVAADISAMMVRRTVARCAAYRPPCVRLDMRRLPFAAGAFAGAWVCASLVHVHDSEIDRCLAELARVLRRGAQVAISMRSGVDSGWRRSDLSPGERWFSVVEPNEFAATLRVHGFADVTIEPSERRDWYIASAVSR